MGRSRMIESFHVSYPDKGKVSAISPASAKQLLFYFLEAHNRSGGAANAGLLVKLANQSWEVGQIIDANTPDLTDKTSEIQGGTATTIFTTTNNDGFLVQADRKFNLIGMNVSDAATGGTFTYQYWDGDSWENLPTIETEGFATTGTKLIVFLAPSDWATGTDAAVGGDSDKYAVRVRATTAPGDSAQADAMWVGKFLAFQESLADNGKISLSFHEERPLIFEASESLMAYFGTASTANAVSGFYSVMD